MGSPLLGLPDLTVSNLAHFALACAFFWLLRLSRKTIRLHALVWWPSTVLHEISHLILGYILFAKPVGFSVIPTRYEPGKPWNLGHVSFARLRWWNKLPVGLAPLILLPPLALWLYVESMTHDQISYPSIGLKLLAIQGFCGAWPSPTDWGHARSTVIVLMAMSAMVMLGYLFAYGYAF